MELTAREIYDGIKLHKRMSILRSMDYIIRTMNHEEAYEIWILIVPDEADEFDCMEIAEDNESFEYTCETFARLIDAFSKYGWE